MFLCIDCAPPTDKWRFDLAMGLSRGPCECCNFTKTCVDSHSGSLGKHDCPAKRPKKADA